MLRSIGFKYINEVDPFDGGPHFQANVDELLTKKFLYEGVLRDTNTKNDLKDWLVYSKSLKESGSPIFYKVKAKLSKGILLTNLEECHLYQENSIINAIPLDY